MTVVATPCHHAPVVVVWMIRRYWRQVLVLVVVTAVTVAVYWHRHEVAHAIRAVGTLSPGWLLVLAFITVANVVTAGAMVASVHPGLTWRRAVTVHQATLAANYSVVASGPVSLALRVSMLRSFDVGHRGIAIGVVAWNVLVSFQLWFVMLVVSLAGVAGAAPQIVGRSVYTIAAGVSVAVLVGSGVWWWLVLSRPRVGAWLARGAQRLWRRVRRRWSRLPEADLVAMMHDVRDHGTALVTHRQVLMVTTTALDAVVLVAIPVLVVHAFGVGGGNLSSVDVIVAFGVVRLASALSPLPGGIGISDVGAVVLLGRLGVADTEALTVVITHRAITFLMPLVLGCVCVWWWQRRSRTLSDRGVCDTPRGTVPGAPSPPADHPRWGGTRCGSDRDAAS
jgi:uncharacterized protein (TIRG00374 family)